MECKKCGRVVEEGFNNCPNCGESLNGKKKEKKPIFKKWWFWVIAVILVIAVLGSIGDDGDDTSTTANANATVAEAEADATTEEVSTEPAIPQSWAKDFYVDDFDEPTDEWYIYRTFSGTFSNSATSDSRLTGRMFIDEEYITIFLYEYNTHQVKNSYSRSENYAISVRLSDGSTKEFSGYIESDGDRIVIDESDTAALKDLLINGGTMKFYIYEEDNSITNYLFEISSDNLKDIIG